MLLFFSPLTVREYSQFKFLHLFIVLLYIVHTYSLYRNNVSSSLWAGSDLGEMAAVGLPSTLTGFSLRVALEKSVSPSWYNHLILGFQSVDSWDFSSPSFTGPSQVYSHLGLFGDFVATVFIMVCYQIAPLIIEVGDLGGLISILKKEILTFDLMSIMKL